MSSSLTIPLRLKLGFALYWLLFAVIAAFAARSPGYVHHPESVHYPWLGLVLMWAILAGLVAAFHLILRPVLVGSSPARLIAAVALSLAMSVASVLTMVTDMPGLFYVPQWFSLLTCLFLLTVGAARAAIGLWHKLVSAAGSRP